MDLFFQKAKVFALDAAKKSQELANQAAKISQDLATETAKRSKELATETAKRSKELAVDVSKKADQLKAYAGELTPAISSKAAAVGATPASMKPTEEELLEYGITPELREFVQGLTIKTFRDFPLESAGAAKESEAEMKPDHITGQDLTDWQERHAVLVLLAVQEMSDFRYVLCPRRMKESRFWKIYFTLVNSYVAPYETRAKERAAALVKEKAENARLAEEAKSDFERTTIDLKVSTPASQGKKESSTAVDSKNPDLDLDAYLMGVDSEDDGDDDDGSDADFDKLVSSTADSDDDSSPADDESKRPKESSPTKTVVAVSEGSSDGELVEIPDTESDQASQKSK